MNRTTRSAAHATRLRTPIGELTLAADGDALVAVWFEGAGPRALRAAKGHPILEAATAQLTAYFAGELTTFDLPLRPDGTDFQRRVWAALREIPFGATASYLDVANRIGAPKACRAVGAANGQNPLPIIVPCHRVIGANGTLTGFGGGLPTKRFLLGHEARQRPLFDGGAPAGA